MANKLYTQYKYRFEMIYVDNVKNTSTKIKTECMRSIIIDHNYEENCMPIIYTTMRLDKALTDDMILNVNKNIIILALYRYDDLTDSKDLIEIFRDRFTYFIPSDVNKNMNIDYEESNIDETLNNTFTEVTMGLMSINMINNNKRHVELNIKDNSIFDCVKYCTSHMKNLIIEPFNFDEKYPRIIMPAQNSINQTLKFLNSYRVFYYTPYRYYQDFNFAYIISSSGKEIPKEKELYSSVLIDIRDIGEKDVFELGTVIDKENKTYVVPVSYINCNVYDNSIINKRMTEIQGVTSNGSNNIILQNNADYSLNKKTTMRLNNDNENMLYNIENKINGENVFLYFNKNDLDTELFTINKKITVHHIPRYQHFNGDYLLSRKRELYFREDTSFEMISMINLHKI